MGNQLITGENLIVVFLSLKEFEKNSFSRENMYSKRMPYIICVVIVNKRAE